MEPLAYVYKSVLSEVLNDISEGIVRSTVEFLDSSTVGLSERAGHESRLDILKNMYFLLFPVTDSRESDEHGTADAIGRCFTLTHQYLPPVFSPLPMMMFTCRHN